MEQTIRLKDKVYKASQKSGRNLWSVKMIHSNSTCSSCAVCVAHTRKICTAIKQDVGRGDCAIAAAERGMLCEEGSRGCIAGQGEKGTSKLPPSRAASQMSPSCCSLEGVLRRKYRKPLRQCIPCTTHASIEQLCAILILFTQQERRIKP